MDREKVIKALECCYCNFPKQMDCKNCPYDKICYHDKACSLMLRDAIALLKEQDAVVRCKDCLFSEQINDRYICTNAGHCQSKSNEPDWFCADGERKEVI